MTKFSTNMYTNCYKIRCT